MSHCLRRRALLGTLGTLAVAGRGSASSEAEVTFVAPRVALIDDPLALELHGLPGARQVEVTSRTVIWRNDEPTTWSASATFESSSDGTVSLHEDQPIEGAYEGVDPMGLVWAMTPESGGDAFFPPRRHQITLTASVDGGTVAETTIDRRLTVDGVAGHSLDGNLVGTMYTPPGDGPVPGVVLLHGSGGIPLTSTARLLSAHGFATLALRYFGNPSPLPDILSAIPIEYVQRAIDRLLARPRVAGPGVGLWGVSKGAELALVVASHDERVDAVVGLAPSSLVWEGFDAEGYPTGTSSWTRNGEPVPYLAYPDYDAVPASADPFERPRSFYEFTQRRAAPESVAAATIPVEHSESEILLFSGTDDRLWHSTPMTEQVIARLDAHDHPHRARHRAVQGAGHVFQLPFLPTYGTSEAFGYPLGGSPAPNARASREHWPAAVDLLADVEEDFEPDPPPVDADGGSERGSTGTDTPVGYTGVVAMVLLAGLVALGAYLFGLSDSVEQPDATGDRAIEGEVTRVASVTYLQGALGHAVGSNFFLGLGGLLWMLGYQSGFVGVAVAFLLSANGLSIWAWDRLQTAYQYFRGSATESAHRSANTDRKEQSESETVTSR